MDKYHKSSSPLACLKRWCHIFTNDLVDIYHKFSYVHYRDTVTAQQHINESSLTPSICLFQAKQHLSSLVICTTIPLHNDINAWCAWRFYKSSNNYFPYITFNFNLVLLNSLSIPILLYFSL